MTNVIGYQKMQYSNKQIINEEGNKKELLLQTIVDMANNKEIQHIILESQINRREFFYSNIHSQLFKPLVITQNQLRHMYFAGVLLSKIINKPRIHSLIEQHQLITSKTQQEISTVIEKNIVLKEKISQLSTSGCDCKNENITQWTFPVICLFLFFLSAFGLMIALSGGFGIILGIAETLGSTLQCFWHWV